MEIKKHRAKDNPKSGRASQVNEEKEGKKEVGSPKVSNPLDKKEMQALVEEEEPVPTVCRVCGALFEYKGLGEYVCPDCGHKEYDSYGLVRSYLEKHPGANILQTEKNTGVSRSKIARMIADERFDISGGRIKM